MATVSKNCGVCELRHITKPTIVWCSECDEGLCTECQEHHSLSKGTRNHEVIQITEYTKLPADILKITQYCAKHDKKKYQIYCQKHEFPCCSNCIVESHQDCQDFVELDDVIHNVKTSNAMCELEETLVEVAENLNKIRQNQQGNLTKFKESRKSIETEIKKTRIKINDHLDKLQEDLMKKLYAEEEKENSKICQLLSSLEKKETEIAECQRNIVNMKQHATDLQVFLSMKKIEEDYSKNKFLQSLEEDKNLNQISISYKINTSIQNIMSDIRSFGEVHIEAKSCDIVLIRKKAKQAQMTVPTVQSRPIENINLTLQKKFNTQGTQIYGCCILPAGRMAFTYYWDCKVIIFNMKGLKDFEVKMPGYAFDIVYISENNTLAVTSGRSEKKCITIIDLEKKQIKKTISLDSNCYGIALKGNQLIYSGQDKGIRMINLDNESISGIVQDRMPRHCYIAKYRDNIYHTNRNTNTVTCYNLQGEIQWKFQNESVLKDPRGIDVDSDGNVYVVGSSSNNVVVISPGGQRHREVLTTDDGLSNPMSLHYSEQNNQLLVVNFNNTAHLFDVS